MDYKIEDLIEIFSKHVKNFEMHNEMGDFNLPKALLVLCKEIQELKCTRKQDQGHN